jgi:hypothetical protein
MEVRAGRGICAGSRYLVTTRTSGSGQRGRGQSAHGGQGFCSHGGHVGHRGRGHGGQAPILHGLEQLLMHGGHLGTALLRTYLDISG